MANNHIISFIQSLSDLEIKIVEEHLQNSQPLFAEGKSSISKELLFFKYIISNKSIDITDEDILKAIPSKDLSNLKKDLYDKVLEALTFDRHISNSTIFNDNSILIFQLKKKLLLLRVLMHSRNQKRIEAIEHLLNEIIEDAKANEIYDILVEALTAKKYFVGIRSGVDEFNKIGTEIDFYDAANKMLYFATDNYYKLIINEGFIKSLTKKEVEKHLVSSIKKMKSDFAVTKSQQINYYIHILEFAYAEEQKDFKKAIELCNKLISILRNNKVIYREERMGLAYINLSLYKTFILNFKEARADAANAQKYFSENSLNYLMCVEQEYHINFYDAEFEKAAICVNKLLNHSLADTGEFRKSKYIYYKANILFAMKQYKESLLLLNESLEIEKDKSRWNISLRILNIMIFIELNKINEASTSLESLRKYMERTSKTDEVKPRDVLIVKLLRELEKDGFMFDPKNTIVSKMLKDLSEKDQPVSWEYFSSELIPFHEWVVGKKK